MIIMGLLNYSHKSLSMNHMEGKMGIEIERIFEKFDNMHCYGQIMMIKCFVVGDNCRVDYTLLS